MMVLKIRYVTQTKECHEISIIVVTDFDVQQNLKFNLVGQLTYLGKYWQLLFVAGSSE